MAILKSLLAFSIYVFLLASNSVAQNGGETSRSVPDPLGRFAKWDPVHQMLLYYNAIAEKNQESWVLFEHGAEAIGVDILRDFSDASQVRVADATGAPGQGILLDAVVEYPPRGKDGAPELNRLVLSYDSSGRLTREWDPFPYECRNIASDQAGNVYCYGNQGGKTGGAEIKDGPLLRRYSPEGDLTGEYLPRGLFPPGIDPIAGDGKTGANRLLVARSGKVILYVASSRELLRLDPDSQHLERMPMERMLSALHYSKPVVLEVKAVAEENDGSILAELILTEAQKPGMHKDSGGAPPAKIVEFSSDLRRVAELVEEENNLHFLGVDGEGRLMFLRRKADHAWSIDQYDKASLGKMPPPGK